MVAHGNAVTTLRSDGDVIVTGGSDGKVKLWDCRLTYSAAAERLSTD